MGNLPITDSAELAEIVAAVREAGSFALDLEFVSESRYVPELGLVQVGWGDPDEPSVAAVDPVALDPRPLVELVAEPEVTVILHAAQGDLSLLARRFEIEAREVIDTQIAAAFLGLGDQIGYTGLIENLFEITLDKGSQFTDWLRRPLSEEQIAYALDDVRYLPAAWERLRRRLAEDGRLDWVREESARLAAVAARPRPPEEAYRRVRGGNKLKGKQLGALQALAAWRERRALDKNLPPSWLLQDRPLLELARRPPKNEQALSAVRGMSEKTARRHGREILEVLRQGAASPPPADGRPRMLSSRARTWASLLSGLIQARCREAGIAPRFVASKSDAEELVRWWLGGDRSSEPDLPLLSGWRRQLAGQAALDWLAGDLAIAADAQAESGIRLVGRGTP